MFIEELMNTWMNKWIHYCFGIFYPLNPLKILNLERNIKLQMSFSQYRVGYSPFSWNYPLLISDSLSHEQRKEKLS